MKFKHLVLHMNKYNYSLFTFFTFFVFSPPAFAYIDPGTGVMVVQTILTIVATLIFYLRNPKQLFQILIEFIKGVFKK
jgi:hypothetical protein